MLLQYKIIIFHFRLPVIAKVSVFHILVLITSEGGLCLLLQTNNMFRKEGLRIINVIILWKKLVVATSWLRGNENATLREGHDIAWPPSGNIHATPHSLYHVTMKEIAWWPIRNVDTMPHSHYCATTKRDGMATLRRHCIFITVWPQKEIAWRSWGDVNATSHKRRPLLTNKYF